ncbi:MAG TPA: CRISPR-associated endonuclease Cas1 [Solirubrobacteraceae bacterium]|nr:CRISPR-associated endonuclease Cas1 [Solirubrobacteraceae bacterium]
MTQPRRAPELVPARMLNEHTYCPRLAYLEWVQGDFADNADTVDGQFQHRNVNVETGRLPDPDEPVEDRLHARSVMLSAPAIGLIARLDLLEIDGTKVTPIDYKRGRAPDLAEGAWEPERVQLCAQALILEENGYQVDAGILYFVSSKQRVEILFDDALRARTRQLLADLRTSSEQPAPPPPLVDSPKCPRCSLVGICLPDETNLLQGVQGDGDHVRRLVPARDEALPLYVQSPGAKIGRSGAELVIETRDGEKQSVRIIDTSQVAVFGPVQVTTQAIQELCARGVSIAYLSSGGWFYGMTRGIDHKNIELRQRQFAMAASTEQSLQLARRLISVKIRNSRTIIRRNAAAPPARTLERLKELVAKVDHAASLESLLGLEGTAARLYFEAYGGMLHAPDGDGEPGAPMSFDFDGRNRRPPRDPVNALLSLGYALLTKDLTTVLQAVGFDPYLGFFHQPRYGRPALALDLMEEFRPLIVDSVVLSAINTGVVKLSDFIRRGGAVALTHPGRGKFLRAYERRMDEEISHPIFGYRISYRRTLEVQVRLLARFLGGEIAEYPPFATR